MQTKHMNGRRRNFRRKLNRSKKSVSRTKNNAKTVRWYQIIWLVTILAFRYRLRLSLQRIVPSYGLGVLFKHTRRPYQKFGSVRFLTSRQDFPLKRTLPCTAQPFRLRLQEELLNGRSPPGSEQTVPACARHIRLGSVS